MRASAGAGGAGEPLQVGQILTDVDFYKITVGAGLLLLLPGWGLKILLAPMYEEIFGADPGAAASMTSLFLAVYGPSRFVLSVLSDTVSPRLLMSLFAGATATLFVAVPETTGLGRDGQTWFTVLILCLSVLFAGSKSVMTVLIMRTFGLASFGTVARLNTLALSLSSVLGPLSATLAAEHRAPGGGHDAYGRWFFTMAGVALLACVTIASVRPASVKGLEAP